MSLDEALVNGCSREIRELRRMGCGIWGRPQASVPRGRVVWRLETEMRVCGSPVRVVRAKGVRRGGILRGCVECCGDVGGFEGMSFELISVELRYRSIVAQTTGT